MKASGWQSDLRKFKFDGWDWNFGIGTENWCLVPKKPNFGYQEPKAKVKVESQNIGALNQNPGDKLKSRNQ